MSTPLRVLIVEDSEDDAVLMLHGLRRGGYDPTSERVDTPEAMNTALDGQAWDIVLSDYAMPHFSLDAALTMVREKGLDLPFVIVSGAIGEEAAVAAMRAGAQDYVMKANLARLVPVVERELREAEIRREHDRMEKALRESKEKYRTILEDIEDGYFEVDIAGNFTFFNDPMCGIIGYSRDEMMGMNNRQFMDKKNAKKVYQAFNRVYTTGKPNKEFGWEIIGKDGTKRFIEASFSLRRNSEGEPIGFRGIVRDITERKRAEEALREGEEKLRYMFESIGDGVIVSDLEGNIVDVNEAELHLLGCSNKEEIIGRSGLQFIAEQDRDRAIKGMMKAVEVGYGAPMQYTFVGKDGREFDGEASAGLLRDSSGSPVGFISLIRDITERKRAEEELRESEEKLRSFMESATDFLTIWDSELNLVDLNEASLRYPLIRLPAEVKKEDFIGKNMLELEPQVKERGKYDQYLEVIKTGKPFFTEDIVPYPKHGDVHLEVRAFKVGDGLGIVTADITDRKRVEEALRESEEKLRIMFESIRDGITVTDLEGRIIDMNEAALRLHGFSNREEVIGQNGLMLAAEKDRARARENARRTFKEGRSGTVEYTLLTKGGEEFEVEYGGALVRDGFGKAVGFIGMARDITERKRAEEELRESQEKLRRFMDSATDFFTIWDSELNLVDVNEATVKYPLIPLPAGAKKGDFIGKNMLDLDPGVKERGIYDQYLEVIKTGKPFFAEDVIPHPKLGDVHLALRAFKVGDGMGIITMDITERKRTEEALRQSEMELDTLIRTMPGLVFYKDTNDRLIRCNDMFINTLGQSYEEVLGKTTDDLYPKQAEDMKRDDREVIESGQPRLGIIEPFTAPEGTRWAQTSKIPVLDVDGKVTGLLGIAIDITDRKRAEEELRESEEKLRIMFESIRDGITVYDLEGRIIEMNEAALRLFGFSNREEVIGQNGLMLVAEKDRARARENTKRTFKEGRSDTVEYTVLTKGGEEFEAEYVSALVRDGFGKAVGFIGIARDITERKRAEEELRESEEKLRSFMESATDFFTIWDSELNLVDLNEASLRYPLIRLPAEVKKEDFIGKNMLELEPHVKERGKYDQYLEVIKTGKPFFTEDIVPYPKHGDVHLEVRAFKVGDGLGIVTADITERKRMEEVLIKGKEQLEQRTNQLLALQKVTATIQSTLEVSEVLQQVSDGVVVNLGFDHTLMFVVDEARNIHRTVVYSTKEESGLVGEVQQAVDRTWAELEFPVIKGYSHALDEVMEGRVVTAHHLYEIAEPPFTRDECNAVQELIGAKAIVIVPFFARDNYIGSIVAFTEREEITEGEIEPLRILADQAGVAIENANLYQGVMERAQRLAVTSELSRIIGSSLDIRETYQALTNEIKKIIDFDLSIITQVEGDRSRFLAVSTEGETGMDEGGTVPLVGTAAAWIVENKRTNIETDFARGVQFPIDVGYMKSGLRSAMRVPLLSKGDVIGTFQLISRHPNAYGEREREILEPVAAQIAAAIENSRLFIQVKEHEVELERAYKELKEAQDYMVRSERLRALGEMAGGVAHDFNNILAVVLGRAQLALEDEEGDKVIRSVRVIEQTALDAAKTVRRLQDFAGVRASSAFEAVNLNQLVEGALEMVESRRVKLEETEGVTIEIGTELNEVAPVAGDAAELREALVNIIFNAMDAMPEGGKITVKSEQENSLVVLSISDTGVGIPEEIKGKLFDPFFTTRAPAGTGLGLSVTYGIVTRHGGSIEVESTQGKGATFYIRLPVADSVEGRSRPERKPPTIKRATILLADDDPEVSEILGLMLQQLGHRVTVVTSGEEALSAFEKGNYGLVITDLGMPDISGRDVARAVKEMKPEMPVMLITGWGVQFDPEEMPDIDGVIEKPFSRDALLAQIAELLPTRNRGKRG